METTLAAFVVFGLCLIGCGTHCWYLGRRVGIQHAVDYLVDKGHLDVDDEVTSLTQTVISIGQIEVTKLATMLS